MRLLFFFGIFLSVHNLQAQAPVQPVPDLLEVIIADGFIPDTAEFPGNYGFVNRGDISKVVLLISDTEQYPLDFFSERIWQLTDSAILVKIRPDTGYLLQAYDFSGKLAGLELISLRDLDKNNDLISVMPVYTKE